jgi:hypothetical protein
LFAFLFSAYWLILMLLCKFKFQVFVNRILVGFKAVISGSFLDRTLPDTIACYTVVQAPSTTPAALTLIVQVLFPAIATAFKQ